jgi:hypothetical protein
MLLVKSVEITRKSTASGSEDWIPGRRAEQEGIWIGRRITSAVWARGAVERADGTRGGDDTHTGEIIASGGREGGGALGSATMSEPRLDMDYPIFFIFFFLRLL